MQKLQYILLMLQTLVHRLALEAVLVHIMDIL